MGSCCIKASSNTNDTLREIQEETSSSDLEKVNDFKIKIQNLKREHQRGRINTFDLLRDALEELDLTEEPINEHYELGKILGSGKYGVVRKGVAKNNPDFRVAVKVIDVSKLNSQFHSLIQEILTLKKADHPNIVKIHEMYRDDETLYLVMEYVDGEELFDFIADRFKLKESEACDIIEQLVKSIRYLNTLGVVHRDLKPENIMINKKTFQIKILDFGLSAYFDESSQLRSKVGTPYYVAPEVLNGEYGKECDMWSVGVICYILLVGYPPFNSKNLKKIYEKIREGKPDYYQSEWENLSKDALDFTNKCIQKDIYKRMTPAKALTHSWITNKKTFKGEINTTVLRRLANFKSPDKLRKEIFQVLVCNVQPDTIYKMNEYFASLDVDNKGEISIKDVMKKFEELKFQSSRFDLLKSAYAENEDLKIQYTDFIARVLDITREVENDDLIRVFQHFDSDGSGKITKDDLKMVMKRKGENLSEEELNELIGQVDSSLRAGKNENNRTEINFETFKNYMLKLSPMSPSLRDKEQFKFKGEATFSMDILDDSNTQAYVDKRPTSIGSRLNSSSDSLGKKQTSFDIQMEYDEN
ncbi:unnamed protein product [Moneuplotes crassus]|uniref:non-specific serine/threonine protein kinase n=1 Tax=Euplotes crassus TaxID=5936 RepID=A0AAD1U6H5_EUPCR|nr:unnamed protein product [Moneuplotes crassus]